MPHRLLAVVLLLLVAAPAWAAPFGTVRDDIAAAWADLASDGQLDVDLDVADVLAARYAPGPDVGPSGAPGRVVIRLAD